MLIYGSLNIFIFLIIKKSYVIYVVFFFIRCIIVIIIVCCLFFIWFYVRGNIFKNVYVNYKMERYVKGNKKKINL